MAEHSNNQSIFEAEEDNFDEYDENAEQKEELQKKVKRLKIELKNAKKSATKVKSFPRVGSPEGYRAAADALADSCREMEKVKRLCVELQTRFESEKERCERISRERSESWHVLKDRLHTLHEQRQQLDTQAGERYLQDLKAEFLNVKEAEKSVNKLLRRYMKQHLPHPTEYDVEGFAYEAALPMETKIRNFSTIGWVIEELLAKAEHGDPWLECDMFPPHRELLLLTGLVLCDPEAPERMRLLATIP